jgi:hypothetical protein
MVRETVMRGAIHANGLDYVLAALQRLNKE